MKARKISEIYSAHKEYWEHHRQELQRYKAAYECEFWDDRGSNYLLMGEQMLNIQTSDAYGYIESFIASLFAKNPSVVLKKGLRNQGNHEKAQAIANDFLVRARQEIENVARMSLLYPMAFFKLVPNPDEEELYDKIYPIGVPCWDIIVDRNASRWDKSKFVAHRYYITVEEARQKFGSKQFTPVHKEDFFNPDYQYDPEEPRQIDEYIEVVEFYDFEEDKLIFYSPQHGQGNNILEESFIPFRSVNNKPVSPIVPLYFNRIPDRPLDGYSSMKRVYDQLFEINIIRSFQANAVRKASRQYLVKAGALDEEDMAKLTAGIDGLFIEVDDENLEGVMRAVPQNPTPPELEQYYQTVNADKDKGSLLAPFTRGEALKATASEIVALASYSATELGRMARERDAAIEGLAFTYLSMLATFMTDRGDNIIYLDNKLQNVKSEDIKGDFEIFAQDQAATPLSEQVKNQQLLANIPVLVQLGVPQRKILEQVVRQLGLPEDFLDTPPQQVDVGTPRTGIDQGPPASPEEAIAETAPPNIKPFIPGGQQ